MISHEGFLYRRDKTKLNTVNWRCAKGGCKGRLTTSLQYRQQQQPPVSSGVHMHPPNPAEVAVRRVENTVKTAAVTTRDPPRRIVFDVWFGIKHIENNNKCILKYVKRINEMLF